MTSHLAVSHRSTSHLAAALEVAMDWQNKRLRKKNVHWARHINEWLDDRFLDAESTELEDRRWHTAGRSLCPWTRITSCHSGCCSSDNTTRDGADILAASASNLTQMNGFESDRRRLLHWMSVRQLEGMRRRRHLAATCNWSFCACELQWREAAAVIIIIVSRRWHAIGERVFLPVTAGCLKRNDWLMLRACRMSR